MFEKQPDFKVESGDIFTRAINNAASVEEVVKILESSPMGEIKDPEGNFYYKENIIADLKDLEEIVIQLSEEDVNSQATHVAIIDHLNRLPNNYSLRQHTLRLLTVLNPVMKKFIF
ncbi:MAG TPA: hypothetical protein PK547_02705 [Candidatus Paceibacterota bacterium]|nr:hypothetical protein [Candidatus Paceibacterota bacterium]